MNSRIRFHAIASCLALIGLAGSAAAARRAPEIYSATEEGSVATVRRPAPRTNPVIRAVMHQSVAAPAVKAAPQAAVKNAYDPVPSDQRDPIARRLQLVELLIREHGRAYDYRVHTVTELKGILALLETANARPVPPAPPKEAPAAAPTAAAEAPKVSPADSEEELSSDESIDGDVVLDGDAT